MVTTRKAERDILGEFFRVRCHGCGCVLRAPVELRKHGRVFRCAMCAAEAKRPQIA